MLAQGKLKLSQEEVNLPEGNFKLYQEKFKLPQGKPNECQ
jgi:hypothetical protein